MYTSGSTGLPKAVMIQHRSLSNHAAAQALPRTRTPDAELMRMATGTSAFIADFFIAQLATLAGGHTLVVLTREQRQDPRYLVALAADPDRAVTALDCTTSQLQLLVEAGLLDAPHPPRLATFGGEACPPDLWSTLRAHPRTLAFNSYGPAETTVEATMAHVTDSPVPLIGRAFGNAVIRVLDDQQRPVPPGTVGELCIAGPESDLGYLGQPAQTAAAFIPDPDGPPGSRLYRTGDLARFTRDGTARIPRPQRPPDQDPRPARRARGSRRPSCVPIPASPPPPSPPTPPRPATSSPRTSSPRDGADVADPRHRCSGPGSPSASPPPPSPPAPLHRQLPASLPGGKLDRKTLADSRLPTSTPPAPQPRRPSTPAEHARSPRIWADLLGREPESLGVHDDFFASAATRCSLPASPCACPPSSAPTCRCTRSSPTPPSPGRPPGSTSTPIPRPPRRSPAWPRETGGRGPGVLRPGAAVVPVAARPRQRDVPHLVGLRDDRAGRRTGWPPPSTR